jgi:hypothetical protein
LQNLSILGVKLAGDEFFDGGLGLVEELVAWVAAVGEVGDEVAGLEGHVELELGDVVAEVFAGLLGGDDLLFQVHGDGLWGFVYRMWSLLFPYYLGWDRGIAIVLQGCLRGVGGMLRICYLLFGGGYDMLG